MIAGDVNGDGHTDVVVTRRRGLSATQDLAVYRGTGSGTVSPTPVVYPSGAILTGGLALRDVDNDGDLDPVTTYATVNGLGQPTAAGVLVYRNQLPTQAFSPLASSWPTPAVVPDIESLVLGQIGGSSAPDVAVGHLDGTLWYGTGIGDARFAPQTIDVESRDTGGGSLGLADVDGNGLLDIVSCKGEESGQAVVQVHRAMGSNNFAVSEIAGWCPQDLDGGTRPLLGDVDGGNDVELIVVHPSNSATVLRNEW